MARYSSIWDGPARNYSKDSAGRPIRTAKRIIVIHNTSNTASDQNEASYAKRRTDGVSSHYYVDNNSILQSLDTDWRAWHVGSSEGNSTGISYEITGSNGKSRDWWIRNVYWRGLAAQIRADMDVHGIAARLLTVAELRAGKSGITTHNQCRLAWGDTTHTDPGPNFPMDYLLAQVLGTAAPSPKPTTPPATGGGGSTNWTKELLMALPTLKQGDRGEDVKRLQALLASNGFPPANTFNSKGVPDGIFGGGTGNALAAFQVARKVPNSVVNGKGDRIGGRWSWTYLLGEK